MEKLQLLCRKIYEAIPIKKQLYKEWLHEHFDIIEAIYHNKKITPWELQQQQRP